MAWTKTVSHVHTDYSDDGNASIESIIDSARVAGVGAVAITDHDTIDGARALAAIAPPGLQVIVGEEISTNQGHLIGLFLKRAIAPGQSARETAEQIRDQGGLVIAPHPFNRLFGCSLRDAVMDILDLIDAVEVCNAQNLSPLPNRRAERFAREHNLARIVGVDMHHRDHLAACFQWMPPFDSAESFRASLRQATLIKGRHSLSYFAKAARIVIGSRAPWGVPADYGRNCTRRRGDELVDAGCGFESDVSLSGS